MTKKEEKEKEDSEERAYAWNGTELTGASGRVSRGIICGPEAGAEEKWDRLRANADR